VTERADLIFAAMLALAAVAAAALLGALVEIGLQGVAGVAAVSAGLVSACILFAQELPHLPPALLFVSLTAVASGAALGRALCSLWREQRLIRALPLVALSESGYRAALPGIPDVDVYVLRSRWQGAFCAGVLRPRVVVSSALLDDLDPDECEAVVAHELSHARGRGPLKLALGRLSARSLFWVPVLRDLIDRYLLLTELAADRAAVEATSPAALAGALSQVLETPSLAGSVGFADHAAARIDRLFDPHAKLPRLVTPARAALTTLALGVVAALAYSSPRLTSSESTQLHTMTVNLLAHHVQARLTGFAITALIVALMLVGARRLARRPR
jgi:Zn-dependent protease with chaperone function